MMMKQMRWWIMNFYFLFCNSNSPHGSKHAVQVHNNNINNLSVYLWEVQDWANQLLSEGDIIIGLSVSTVWRPKVVVVHIIVCGSRGGVRQTSINGYGVSRVHGGWEELFTIGGAWRASGGEERVPVGLASAHWGRQRGRACTHAPKTHTCQWYHLPRTPA